MNPYHPFKSREAKEQYLKYYDRQASRWPTESASMTVKTAYGETFVRISGAMNSSTIVLLTGDTENSLSWIPQIKALSENHRVIAIDHIYDNGRSIYTVPLKQLQDHIAWLDELLAKLSLTSFHLIGFSYGAWLATMYTLLRPDNINKTVLISPSATVLLPKLSYLVLSITTHFFPTRYLTEKLVRWERNGLLALGEEGEQIIDSMVETLLVATKCFKRRNSFVSPSVLTAAQWQSLDRPLLYMVGEKEVIYDAKKAVRRLNKVNPSIETAIINGVSHDIAITKAAMVNQKILDFLSLN